MREGGTEMGRDMENRKRWEKEYLRSYTFKVNKNTDADVIEYLEKIPNKRAYLIELIRKDMKEG